uniref:SAM-dependent methyltransferase n=1 Tax=Syphacia muris TaxID=451379 RepID=A0A0N5AL81_9BILA
MADTRLWTFEWARWWPSRTLVGLNSNNFQQLNADDWLSVLEVYPESAHEVDARKPAGRFILSFSAIRRH